MTTIDAGNPDTRLLQEAQRKRRTRAKGRVKSPAYGKLPEPFLSQAQAIASIPRHRGGLSDSRIKVMGCAIRRLLRSTESHGLEPELTMDTARAFAEDLFAGDLKTISAAGYCDFLGYFAKHAGYGRDPLAPIKDAVTADGDLVVPIDAEAFGFWLKAAFGSPNTTGTTDKTHIFKSGGWTLPSMAIEVAMPEVPRFAMYTGCVLDQLSWQMQRSGLLTATAKLIAQGETVATSTAAGTPTTWTLQRFGHFNGSIKRNGTALGIQAERRGSGQK